MLLGYLYAAGADGRSDEHYGVALRINPALSAALGEYAWRVASGPPQSVTAWDLSVATLFARQACQATQGRNPQLLETLAAVELVAGRNALAADCLREAIRLTAPTDIPESQRLQRLLSRVEGR
jgi:hypothetical protein